VLHAWHARRLAKQLANSALPRHVGLVMDGNRRCAHQMGFDDPSVGHRRSAGRGECGAVRCKQVNSRGVTAHRYVRAFGGSGGGGQ
jgi:short-chain Z-isoprenyl diphosphate synthase